MRFYYKEEPSHSPEDHYRSDSLSIRDGDGYEQLNVDDIERALAGGDLFDGWTHLKNDAWGNDVQIRIKRQGTSYVVQAIFPSSNTPDAVPDDKRRRYFDIYLDENGNMGGHAIFGIPGKARRIAPKLLRNIWPNLKLLPENGKLDLAKLERAFGDANWIEGRTILPGYDKKVRTRIDRLAGQYHFAFVSQDEADQENTSRNHYCSFDKDGNLISSTFANEQQLTEALNGFHFPSKDLDSIYKFAQMHESKRLPQIPDKPLQQVRSKNRELIAAILGRSESVRNRFGRSEKPDSQIDSTDLPIRQVRPKKSRDRFGISRGPYDNIEEQDSADL